MPSYKNFFYSPKYTDPAVYHTDAKPVPYRGFLIYQRIKGVCWDIVKDGICVGQYAGLSGAKGVIDEPTEWFTEKMNEAFPKLLVRRIRRG